MTIADLVIAVKAIVSAWQQGNTFECFMLVVSLLTKIATNLGQLPEPGPSFPQTMAAAPSTAAEVIAELDAWCVTQSQGLMGGPVGPASSVLGDLLALLLKLLPLILA